MQKQFIKGLVTKIAEGKYRVLASTAAIDRQGDSIDQNGWDISNFKLNPVMLWAHDYSELPAAKVTSIEITERGLEAEFEFAPAEGNPKAQQIKVLYDEGYLNAVSVGFIPKERKGNTITRSELLEISFVPVPANQEALRLAFAQKSIDISALPEMKGAVEDEVTAEEVFEQKWQKWDEFCGIISALWTVYFDEKTPVEDFGKLIDETIVLLQEYSAGGTTVTNSVDGEDNDEDEDEEEGVETETLSIKKSMTPENLKSFMEALVGKSGRTLSKKTLEKVDEAINSMKGATSVLEELKAASSDDEQDGKGDSSKEEKGIEVPALEQKLQRMSAEDIKLYRQSLVVKDKTNEFSLSVVNKFMREKGIN